MNEIEKMDNELIKTTFSKIIRNIILPKYPWIKDFEVTIWNSNFDNLEVIYKIDVHELGDNDLRRRDEFYELDEEGRSLFRMLGLKGIIYRDTKFRTYD